MSGLLSPDIQETVIGTAQILSKYLKYPVLGKVAGSKVMDGEILPLLPDVRIIRDGSNHCILVKLDRYLGKRTKQNRYLQV